MARQDIRLDMEFINHPKTKRVIRKLGHKGFYSLVCLFSNVAKIYPKGKLKGCDKIDIADMANWDEDPDELIKALMDEKVRFLEFTDGEYCIHDWEDNQPYVYHSDKRIKKAKKAAAARWNEHYEDKNATSNATSNAMSNATSIYKLCNEHSPSNAPTPIPTPIPTPKITLNHASEKHPTPKDAPALKLESEEKPSKTTEPSKTMSQALQLASLLLHKSREFDPKLYRGKDKHVIQRWANDIEKLIRIDGRSFTDIEAVIRWVKTEGNFWLPNIMSGRKLREKFPQLFARMNNKKTEIASTQLERF
ncbi:MAG: hypothetical protein K9L24_03670 [Spirochaetia bacterium]|nr:hypothetical protein [Spirochaetia bacterium]